MGIETATIVMADLVASTELRVGLGEERADQLRRDVDDALAAAVVANGGRIVKGLGDGVLAMFGGATDAVTAAVAMHQAAVALGGGIGARLGLRVGCSAGDVSLEDGDCFGTPVVEAARLCSTAEPGQVLVADVVRVLARGRGGHAFESCGALDLKGLPEPVVAWSVPWEPAADAGTARTEAPYVGRAKERRLLQELLAQTAEGAGATVLVAGEPGIGKSRLVTEACRELDSHDVLWGGCHDGDVLPGTAFAEAITTWARRRDASVLVDDLGPEGPVIATLAPTLRDLAPSLPEAPAVPGDAAIARLQDAVSQWVAGLCSQGPVVLVIDDLHWADDTTVRLLRTVARAARQQRLLLIGTYRETDLDRNHPFAEALPLLRREAEPTRIALDGLGIDEVTELLGRMAGHDVPAAFAALLADQCGGNPFFIRETVLHLAEEGRIELRDGVWTATTDDLGIPEGVREVLGRRLARLSDTANHLLSVGALFEVAFSFPVVCDVAGIDENVALDAIDEALTAQVITATGDFDRYAFTHALFRHTLVGELNPSRQVRAHRAIAEAMEKRIRGVPSPGEAASLARHYHRSSAMPGAERGVPHALQAASHAEASSAFAEAHELCAIARELLEEDDDRRIEIQHRLTTNAVLARITIDEQVREATLLGELVAAERGDDAAADMLTQVVETSFGLDDAVMTWQLAGVARRWLRPDRRDTTWVSLRGHELTELEATSPDFHGLSLDTPERRELFEVCWTDLDRVNFSWSTGFPGRPVALRFLERSWEVPLDEAFLRFNAGKDIPRMIERFATGGAEALASGRIGHALLSISFEIRGHLVLGDHAAADRGFAEGAELAPRLSERSSAVFLYMACYSFAGWTRGVPLLLGDSGIDDESERNPNTSWAGMAIRVGGAATRAWLDPDDPAPIEDIELVVPAVEGAAGYAPNYPIILHSAVATHWWLQRRDLLEPLRRNLEAKVLEPDQRYLETDGRWIAARIASLEGRHDDARAWFDAARAELEAEGLLGLLASVEFDVALAESRAGAAGDPDRFAAAVERVHELTTHPTMAAWRERLASVPAPGDQSQSTTRTSQ